MTEMRFTCPGCGKALKCDAKFVGLRVKCPECGGEVIVPRPMTAAKSESKDDAANDEEGTAKETPASGGASPETVTESREPSPPTEPRPPVSDEEPVTESESGAPDDAGQDADEADQEEVDEAIAQYLEDDQPAKAVRKTLERVAEFLKDGETVEYIAVQHNPINPLDNIDPGCVVVTPRRLIICRPKLLGRMEFRGFSWYEVTNLRLAEKLGGATIAFKSTSGEPVSVDLIPKKQARHLYTTAQRCYEAAREERRLRTLEQQSRSHAREHRAPVAPPPSQPTSGHHTKGDPVTRLKQLKEMLDLGLITHEDYAAKKQELLAEL